MSNKIPKEQMSAFQRWEMSSFDAPSVPKQPALETPVLPTKETIELIKEEARVQGFAEGLAEGRTQGLLDGRQAAAQEAARLNQILTTFAEERAQIDALLAKDLLDLVLVLTKNLLKAALPAKPDLILPLVKDMLHGLPGLQQPAVLGLNPADAEIVRQHLTGELSQGNWRIHDDSSISRGGCRVDTASNQVDATIETRWQRLSAALGQETLWAD